MSFMLSYIKDVVNRAVEEFDPDNAIDYAYFAHEIFIGLKQSIEVYENGN